MKTGNLLRLAPLALVAVAGIAGAQNVKITPYGSHAGELCNRDRAMILEDPTGVRLLYDPGQAILGGDDPRLGTVHVLLVSHAHGDHIGDTKLKALGAGTCDAPELVSAAPATTSGEIAAAKNAGLVMMLQMANFLGKRVEAIKGKPTPACPATNASEHVVPFATTCLAGNNLGGSRTFRMADQSKAVEIVIVPASHDSTPPRALLSEAVRNTLEPDNMSIALGPPTGYVVRFTNGLVLYLTGDTAIHADMKALVHDFHRPNAMALNLGPSAGTPAGQAFIVDELIQPATVIVTHTNDVGTVGGKVKPNTRVSAFLNLLKRPYVLAVSGRTIELDGAGKCAAGCG
jgi:L-ascorbate metabolism protein UlaG (beta-lactamase superfamily)